MVVRKCNMPLKTKTPKKIRLYLCHVCKGEVGRRIFLVFLDNFKKLCLPLHRHFKLGVLSSIVVEGEGQEESFSVSEFLICLKKKQRMLKGGFFGGFIIQSKSITHSHILLQPKTGRRELHNRPCSSYLNQWCLWMTAESLRRKRRRKRPKKAVGSLCCFPCHANYSHMFAFFFLNLKSDCCFSNSISILRCKMRLKLNWLQDGTEI